MPRNADNQQFRNEELVLRINQAVDRSRWDESRYEAFIDELCGSREYQKEAIRVTLRYLLAGEYFDLHALAKENFNTNDALEARYGSWPGMERHLQMPDKLSASLDLATGVGKSYVLYGLAAILLAEGAVDRVLVLCPSTTIEYGLMKKFGELAANADLRELLPPDSKINAPSIINASQTITEGSICVENYHAVLEHVGSSIRESLKGKGERAAVLNDEAHHVANESGTKLKKWKEFLTNPDYAFRYIVGVSGTCYVKDEYFADVIFRYSLRQAIEEKYIKKVDYIAEMPRTGEPDDKWQLIRNQHEEIKRKLRNRDIIPLTIIVTQTISDCKDVAEELKGFLIEQAGISVEDVADKVLVIYNNAPDLKKLTSVDRPNSPVEWIVAVSMLNEGWDVKRVFQIVPHKERAFNSKLLIAQVLGRGLRVPNDWVGKQPEVTVFNHDAWAPRIRHLVNEILEIEKRLTSRIIEDSAYHFDLLNIDYTLKQTSVEKQMEGEYALFTKGYVDLATDSPAEDVSIEFERATTGERYKWQTTIYHKTYTPNEIAHAMYARLEEAQDADDPNPIMRTIYTDQFPITRLEEIVKSSLERRNTGVATESMKQKFLQSLGTLRRQMSKNVRYTPIVDRFQTISTRQRQANSVSVAELRSSKSIFFTDQTRNSLVDEQIEFFDEVTEQGSGYKGIPIGNRYDFKTPMNLVIADSDNEQRFIKRLIESNTVERYDAWLKSAATRFYEIDYAWKKGEHPKRGKFSPDFFIKAGDLIIVVEIKGDEELREPSDENIKKYEYAMLHFERINEHLKASGDPMRYKLTFLTEQSYNQFFQSLKEETIVNFRSELDVRLTEIQV
ncbi:MAG: DEAD/DEAH box helicase family protein [Gracilibacteraceae bacterium]|jgi:type III restriction enzyme|nr:DEAD/DEAH box helicase family protein [Gracilibacteraceae bacterium]